MAVPVIGPSESSRTTDYQIWHFLKSMETVSVGIVHKFNPKTRRADIRTKPKVWHEAGEHELDIKRNVPVVVLGGGPYDVEPPIHDEFNPFNGRPDIVLLVYSKYPLEQLLDNYKPVIAIPGHSATFSQDNMIALPLRFWTKADGYVDIHNTYKEVKKESVRDHHDFRIFHQTEHQEIVLHSEVHKEKPKWMELQTPTRINLIEDAPHNVPNGPLILKKYNSHGHPLHMPGAGGPPPPKPKWVFCDDLSKSVFVGDGEEATCDMTYQEAGEDVMSMVKDFICNDPPADMNEAKDQMTSAVQDSVNLPDEIKQPVEDFIGGAVDDVIAMGVDTAIDFGMDMIGSFIPLEEVGGLLDAGAKLLEGDIGGAFGELFDSAIGGAIKSLGLGPLEGFAKGLINQGLAMAQDAIAGAGCE